MLQAVESEAPAFGALPGPGDFERGFDAAIENGAQLGPGELDLLCRVDIEKVGNERVVGRHDGGFPKVTRLVVVGRAKANARDYGKPAEVGIGERELVERIQPQGVVIVGQRAIRKAAMEIGEARFALVKNRPAKQRSSSDIERNFRQPLGCLKEVVRLKTGNPRERVIRVVLSDRDDVVRLRVDLKFALEKILEDVLVAQLCAVSDGVDVLG